MFALDDFYSLTSYASRFSKNPDRLVDLYLSQKSTAAAVAVLEKEQGDGSFRMESLDELFRRAGDDEVTSARDFIAITGCRSIAIDSGEVIADIRIYSDFVAFLTASGINC